jgi:hypothetical protein
MNNRFYMNIYLKRNNRACTVFKRNGILYRINNLTQAKEFVQGMKEISESGAEGAEKNYGLTLNDHRGKMWVLECRHEGYMVSVYLWYQKSFGDHMDVRFSWKGTREEFMTAVHFLSVAADQNRIYQLYKKD